MTKPNAKRYLSVSDSVIDEAVLARALKFCTDQSCGAVSTFSGITRRDTGNDSNTTVGLFFETHIPLAESVLEEIVDLYCANEDDGHQNIQCVFIQHRLGLVPVGETNIIVAVSAPHRRNSIKAVEELMNEVKAKLPIWKKEIYSNGTFIWKENPEFHKLL